MNLFKILVGILPDQTVWAHCDVPCGIYDPKGAQTAAQTVLKMAQLIKELPEQSSKIEDRNKFVRCVKTKEEHAQKCKEEILILWTDYFKSEHLDRFPDLHEKIWSTTKLCSKNKQAVDEDLAQELVKAVDEIAEIFSKSKTP